MLIGCLVWGDAVPVAAQWPQMPPTRDSLLTDAIARSALEPAEAARRFERLTARDPLDAEAHWRAAIAWTESATALTTKPERPRRDTPLRPPSRAPC